MTAPTIHSGSTQKYFNSHPHEEDDEAEVDENGEELSISTHILTKRMTFPATFQAHGKRYFNSHPHEEDDV